MEFEIQEIGHSQLHVDVMAILEILSQSVNYRLKHSLCTLCQVHLCSVNIGDCHEDYGVSGQFLLTVELKS